MKFIIVGSSFILMLHVSWVDRFLVVLLRFNYFPLLPLFSVGSPWSHAMIRICVNIHVYRLRISMRAHTAIITSSFDP